MSKKHVAQRASAERVVKDIRCATRKLHSSEEYIRIGFSGLRGEGSIAELCRSEGITQSLYYSWSTTFMLWPRINWQGSPELQVPAQKARPPVRLRSNGHRS